MWSSGHYLTHFVSQGAAVLRMIEFFMTDETLRDGLRVYFIFKTYMYTQVTHQCSFRHNISSLILRTSTIDTDC